MTQSVTQKAWGVPTKYLGTGPMGRMEFDYQRFLSDALNTYAEIDDCIIAISLANDTEALAEWRDWDWETVGRETGGDDEEAAEYAARVRRAFDDLIAACPLTHTYSD